jgi:ankyrin repeat protein
MADPCQDFLRDPFVNPRTGGPLTKGSRAYRKLVRECGDPNDASIARDSDSNTSLIQAVLANDLRAVRLSLSSGVDVNAQNDIGDTALIIAADRNHVDIVRMLIKAKANLDLQEEHQRTALTIAMDKKNTGIAKLLIEANANLDLQDEDGDTALMIAAGDSNLELVNILINAKANLEIKDTNGNTALLSANYDAPDVINRLIEAGVDVNTQNDEGDTPLMYMSALGNVDIVELLIENGANLNTLNQDGQSALKRALDNDHIEIVRILIENGANLDQQYENGDTLLISALYNRKLEMANLLLEAKADPNIKAYDGNTALIMAVIDWEADIVNLLLKAGADMNIQDSGGNTALLLAANNDHRIIVRMLIGADLDIQNNNGDTALILAVHKSHVEMSRMLIEAGANPNIKSKRGYSALMLAIFHNNESIVQLLLEHGVETDPNIQNVNGNTPLIEAAAMNNSIMLKLLIEAGADPNIQSLNGKTALIMLIFKNRFNDNRLQLFNNTKLLIEAGADPNIQNNSGRTARDYLIRPDQRLYDLLVQAEEDAEIRIAAEKLERFDRYRTILNTMDLCNYNSFTPVSATDDLYELCLYQDCDFYLKVFNLGPVHRLNELTKEFNKLNETVAPELDDLRASLRNITGTTENDMRDKRRIQREIFVKGGRFQQVSSTLLRMRGDFDNRRKNPDVIDSIECEYGNCIKGIIVIPKSWGYLRCSNPSSLITLDSWGDVKNRHPVQIFIYNTELNKHLGLTCFNYSNLAKYLKEGIKLRNWIRNDPDKSIEEGIGYGGGPGTIVIRKFPDGTYVLDDSLNTLNIKHIYYALLPVYLKMLVGNKDGSFGESMSHGQHPVTVYRLFKADENGLLLHVPPVDGWTMNPNLTVEIVNAISA